MNEWQRGGATEGGDGKAESTYQGVDDRGGAERQFGSGVALALVGTMLFAMKSIFIKFAFAAGATAETFLTLRMLLALPFYVVIFAYAYRDDRRTRQLSWPLGLRALLLGFLGYYLASYLDLEGLERISAQLERLTLFTYPTMVAVLAWLFLGERITWRIGVALAACYSGVALMYVQESQFGPQRQIGLGMLLVVGSALSYSCYIVSAKPVMQRIGSRLFTSLAMIGSTCFVMIQFCAFQPLSSLRLPAAVWGYASLVAFVCTVIPSFLINEAVVRLGATRTMVIGSGGPVVTVILAIAVLREPASPLNFVGMSLVLAGVLLVSQRRTPNDKDLS